MSFECFDIEWLRAFEIDNSPQRAKNDVKIVFFFVLESIYWKKCKIKIEAEL